MKRNKGTISSLGVMGLALLLLPFFGTSETGCRPSVPYPCEAEPVLTAASGLLTDWAEEHGPFYELRVAPFTCPDPGRVEKGRVIPVFTSFGPTLCGDYSYWEDRGKNRAGSELAQQLAERFRMPRPPSDEPPPRRPGQVDVEVAVSCVPNPTPEALSCEVSASLASSPPGEPAEPGPPAAGPTARSTSVNFSLPRTDHRPLSTRPPWRHLWTQMTGASPMPLVIAKRGVDELAVVYFILVILTGGALLIELRWRWPRVQLALSAWVVIGTLALAFLFVDNSLSACGPYFTAQPNLRFYAFFDYLFADLQVGFLLFLGAGIADTVFGTRRWWQQRRAR